MAKKEEFEFLSANKKTKIHAVKWIPDTGEVRAVFQIIHGMIEYIERYEEFAEFLTEQGFVVVGHDHLGHGQSIETEDDWGFIHEQHGSDLMVSDIHALREKVQGQYGQSPYFILGHSMGSYLLRKYLTIHGECLTSALIVGTGTMPDVMMRTGMFLCRVLAKVHGWRYRSDFVRKMSFAGPYKKFDLDGSLPENSWLTKEVEIVNHYYSEPRCTFMFTINGYYSLMETILYDNQTENIEKIPKELPLILISGKDDPVGNLGEGVKKVFMQLKKAGIWDLTCKLYENDRHEILNETDRETVYGEILSWCLARIDRNRNK
ncbi:MAG: alpha/beta hydrolase [Lachnospiraceae bacterium]|jgi:alpha-beta hydrolase superfamily lysophospholipase|nr:alpha/beta hydrolase [Lachnospiraceae bacterium]